jgi:hypothetical protein
LIPEATFCLRHLDEWGLASGADERNALTVASLPFPAQPSRTCGRPLHPLASQPIIPSSHHPRPSLLHHPPTTTFVQPSLQKEAPHHLCTRDVGRPPATVAQHIATNFCRRPGPLFTTSLTPSHLDVNDISFLSITIIANANPSHVTKKYSG